MLQYVVARNDHVPQEGFTNKKDDEEIELGNPPIEEIADKRRSATTAIGLRPRRARTRRRPYSPAASHVRRAIRTD